MRLPLLQIVVLAFVPLALRIILYLVAFKVRSIHIKLLNCIVIAGAGYLVGFLVGALRLPLPLFIQSALSIGLAMFLITRYTEADVFPDVIFIPLAVELVSSYVTEQVLVPMLQ